MLTNCPPELRHWEWGYLVAQCHRDIRTLQGDWAANFAWLCLSPSGEDLAAFGDRGLATHRRDHHEIHRTNELSLVIPPAAA